MDSRQTILTVAITALLAVSLLSAPAAAQTDDDGLTGVFSDDTDDSNPIDVIRSWAAGVTTRLSGYAASVRDDTTSTDAARDATEAFNDGAAARTSWANARTSASTDADVLKVRFRLDDGIAVRYVVADVADGAYENVSMVAETDRDPDETCTLEGGAARNAADEIERFDDTFVDTDSNVSNAYLTELATAYGGQVDCSFTLPDS